MTKYRERQSIEHTPASELKAEAEKLQRKADSGDITPAEAERLADLNRALRRIDIVKFGKAW